MKKLNAYCPISCDSLDILWEDLGDPHDVSWCCRKYRALLKEKDDGRKVKIVRCADCLAGKEPAVEKIESCPFCNGEGKFKHKQYASWFVICLGCGARGPTKPTGEEAAECWNRRAEK